MEGGFVCNIPDNAFDRIQLNCRPCPPGTYSSYLECLVCPAGMQTLFEMATFQQASITVNRVLLKVVYVVRLVI